MTVNLPIWAGALYSFLLIGGAFGAGIAAFRNGNRKAQADAGDAQKDAIEAMQAQIASQKDAAAQDRQEIATLKAKVMALETFNGQLASLLTGRPDWEKISGALDAYQKSLDAHTALSEKIARHLGVE